MKKLAFLLILAQLAALAACGGTAPADDTTAAGTDAPETTEAVDYLETLPKEDFGGYEFRVIAQSYDQRPNLPLYEEENGEVLNDAIHARNHAVEERLNITFVNHPYENRDDVRNLVKSTVMADEDAYDLIITSINFGINTLQSDGCLYDLALLSQVQLDQPWWCTSIYDDHQMDGHIYFTSGPLSPFFYYMPAAIAYNKTMTDNYKITGLEQLVLDGKWTFDKLKEFTAGKAADLNGDSVLNENDSFAFVGSHADAYMLAGFGERMITRADDGGFTFNMDSESFVVKLQALSAYLNDADTAYCANDTTVFLGLFQKDQGMFMPTAMNNIITGYSSIPSCREMKSDYGILPLPKYDEAQENYQTPGQPAGPSGIAVPATCRDADRTALVMETMAYISGTVIREAVYESIVKGKAARLEGTDAMLDIVYETLYFDLNEIFDFGKTKTARNDALLDGGANYASAIASLKTAANEGIDDYVAMLSSIG